jgi:hypothetical protein
VYIFYLLYGHVTTVARSNGAADIYNVVKEAKDYLEAQGITVVAVVGDNASGVQSALARCVHCPLMLTCLTSPLYCTALKKKTQHALL